MEQTLHHALGFPVGVHGLLNVILGNRDLKRVAVGGTGGRENYFLHISRAHGIQQIQGIDQIVAEVQLGSAHGLADICESGKVEYRVDRVLSEYSIERAPVADVRLNQGAPFYGLAMSPLQIIEDDWLHAGLGQDLRCVAADVAGSAGN
jgi:hypothetical protein